MIAVGRSLVIVVLSVRMHVIVGCIVIAIPTVAGGSLAPSYILHPPEVRTIASMRCPIR